MESHREVSLVNFAAADRIWYDIKHYEGVQHQIDTYLKTHPAELISGVNETRSPMEQMRDAIILLRILSQSDAEYRKGYWKSQEDVEAELEKRFIFEASSGPLDGRIQGGSMRAATSATC